MEIEQLILYYDQKIKENYYNNEELSKIFFEYCEEDIVNYNMKKVDSLINRNFIPRAFFDELLNDYIVNNTGMNEDEIKDKLKKIKSIRMSMNKELNKDHNKEFFSELINKKTNDEIIDFIQHSAVNVSELKGQAFDYVITNPTDDADNLIKELREKVQIFLDARNEKMKERRNYINSNIKKNRDKDIVSEIRNIIILFINSANKSKAEFCVENGIDIRTFESYIKILNKYDNELYDKYIEKIEIDKRKRYYVILNTIKNISKLIENGILNKNGEMRKFDLLDYYLITKLSFDELIDLSQEVLNKDELKKIRVFVNINRGFTHTNAKYINELLNSNLEVGFQKDENGYPIDGTGRIITKDEKQLILDYLKKYKIPINSKTFNLTLKRYISGDLNYNSSDNEILESNVPHI